MQVKKIEGDFAWVEKGGLLKYINIQMTKGLKCGDYVMVHAGFAIGKVKPKKAKEVLKYIDGI